MKLADIISDNAIVNGFAAENIKEAAYKLAENMVSIYSLGIAPKKLGESLYKREKLGSTGVGNGIAFPHARISDLPSVYGLIAISRNGINFNAEDNKPVNILFTIIGPEDQPGELLKALALASKIFRNKGVLEKILKIKNIENIYDFLKKEEKKLNLLEE